MIGDIGPRKLDPAYKNIAASKNDYIIYIRKNLVLLRKSGEGEYDFEIPVFSDFEKSEELLARAYYLYAIDDMKYFYVTDAEDGFSFGEDAPEGYEYRNQGTFTYMLPKYQALACVLGLQVHRWKTSRKFCGRCGHPTVMSEKERAIVCPECGATEYPKISPAVIVAVTNSEGKILMTRYRITPEHPFTGLALVAGFVEIGESFEEALHREVMEEVGLKIKNIRYYRSQGWPFSDSEMVGFFAEVDGDDTIRVDGDELSEGNWYSPEEVPDVATMNSIAGELMMVYKYGSIAKCIEATGDKYKNDAYER